MATPPAELRVLAPADERELEATAHLFDGAILVDTARRFLSAQNNHLVLAYLDAHPVGFVSGVETTHPD